MTRIIVTGGAGFIGSNLCHYLQTKGYDVTSLDIVEQINTPWRSLQCDIRDPIEIENIDIIVHLAAQISVPQSIIDPDETLSINVDGTKNIIQLAEQSGVSKIIFASSAAVYGDAENMPISESCPLMPQSPYAVSKILGEELLQQSSIQSCSLRFFNVYGPGQSADGGYAAVIPAFKKAITENRSITFFGDGTQIRDFIHVSDLVRIIEIALNTDNLPSVVNLGSGSPASLLDLFEALKAINPNALQPLFAPERVGDIHTSIADVSQMHECFNPEKMITLVEGLQL